MEWQKVSNTRLRCLRITSKEEKAVRSKLQVRALRIQGLGFQGLRAVPAAPRSKFGPGGGEGQLPLLPCWLL